MIAPGSTEIPGNPSRIPWGGRQSGESGQAVGAGEHRHVSAGSGEEFRAEQRADSRQTQQDLGVLMLAEAALDLLVELVDLCVQRLHVGGHRAHQGGSDPFCG
ncbi:hypothetical protein AOB60_01610 [Streptomyces noursei]|uniref:Uncharacterized protein n=1 Tax=Streptomyces noursei TaxID=1971 RepID=A0A2N8PFU3_STRNR|nr:hypothetical protein AOB60_01610 [Streptomyces noursei]